MCYRDQHRGIANILVLAAPPPIQFSANAPTKALEDNSSAWEPGTHRGDPEEAASSWFSTSSCHYGIWEEKQ